MVTTESVAGAAGIRNGEPLVQIRDLKVHFPVTSGIIIQRQVGAVKAAAHRAACIREITRAAVPISA